ncbi:MAG: hypothetical protein JOZ15_03170 [Acidobacteria bacterium]|nr:hypothetical protein [Acidobacteriota bacterium]
MPGPLSLALAPAPLLAAVVLAVVLPRGAIRAVRFVALAALVLSLGFVLLDAAPSFGGGRILASFGDALPGVPYLFSADGTGALIACAAVVAALLFITQPADMSGRAVAGLLGCAGGAIIAAFAGNAVMLFAGMEVANVGVFGLLTEGGRRPGRAAVAALVVEHAAALSLLAAAANLQASSGTSDFGALPAGAVTAAVAVPWALAASIRLLAPLVTPLRLRLTAAWAATAAVPTGAVVLLRLREVLGGAGLPAAAWTLAAVGSLAAIAGATIALRSRSAPGRLGRALMVVAAGTALAVAGFPQAPASTAVAAGVAALELVVAMSAIWESAGAASPSRVLAPAALLLAGGLPFGFGATAAVLEASAALGRGLAAMPVVAAVLVAAIGAAAAAVVGAAALSKNQTGREGGGVRTLGVVAIAASVAGAVVPGAAVRWLGVTLGGPTLLIDAGAGSVAGPAGGWAAGYFLVAGAILAAAVMAAASLSGIRLPLPKALPDQRALAEAPSPGLRPAAAIGLGPYRTARRLGRVLGRAIPAVDGWLVQQPQLPLIAAGSLLAVLLVR